ncbi:MAG: NAD(P)/FAD-dependent oxidoreductase [Nitrospirae bacterium]|nr:NAD(P)/FAD-dependent oxidoreductase [Nitrospirota bacterium]
MNITAKDEDRHGECRRVVILGGGFAGLTAARTLEDAPVRVTLVDARNYYLFQPLLYQVATGDLHAEAVATPFRRILRKNSRNFILGTVTGIDPERKEVHLDDGSKLGYDRLLVALGSTTRFFGKRGIARHACHLKGLTEAESLRSRILFALERASRCPDPGERREWLTFAIAGGGSTGVECACGILELFRILLPRDYPEIDPREVSVRILQGSDALIPDFPSSLRDAARKRVEELGGRVLFDVKVDDYDGQTIRFSSGDVLRARTLVWAAGVEAPALIRHFPGEKGEGGRIRVNDRLQIPMYPDIHVLGDLALPPDGPHPQVAPFAIQCARHVARSVLASWNLGPFPPPFVYRDPGSMVVLGRYDAVCHFPRWGFGGRGITAWVAWLGLHLAKILGTRNRLLTLADWGQDYLFRSAAMEILRQPESVDLEKEDLPGS